MPISHADQSPKVEIFINPSGPQERRLEPVTCGIPWPRGVLRDASLLALEDGQGNPVPLQTEVLDRWPDGSVRWVLLDWQANVTGPTIFKIQRTEQEKVPQLPSTTITTSVTQEGIQVDTGARQFRFRTEQQVILIDSPAANQNHVSAWLYGMDDGGDAFACYCRHLTLEVNGPLRATVASGGVLRSTKKAHLCDYSARFHFFVGSPVVRVSLTLTNPRKAKHPRGFWDLGQRGSILFHVVSLGIAFPASEEPMTLFCSPEPGLAIEKFQSPFELYQDSSSGHNWNSRNHVNQNGAVSTSFRGYKVTAAGVERTGQRATPIVVVEQGSAKVAVTMPYFWETFPKAVKVSSDGFVFDLFAFRSANAFHELQGGEQKTHEFYIAFGQDTVTPIPLDWCRSPLVPHASPEWYAASGAVPYLTPKSQDRNIEYLNLVDAAVEGEDTFKKKREIIDEYGWRNFGDVYADHEAVFHQGPEPLISHYNNQYDLVAGFAYQFMRSGDLPWHALMRELAAHVIDIDTYHTDRDKPAYNHGQFWHTFHYTDAGTSTHRSYSSSMKNAPGGGPSNEHNYATGLLLHYFLTGDPMSKEAVIERAQWVMDIDDGKKTLLRWLDRGDTGLAISTHDPSYHGPGRGAANSIVALLNGFRLTGAAPFLTKAEQLIRRCIHPADNLAARNLLDAERRWSYTVFLQALGHYLDFKLEHAQPDKMFAYVRQSLLHYSRWMAANEYPYLDKPAKLEYPTETWAAQDMRKSEVFQFAAKYSTNEEERSRFLERSEFFFRYSTRTLASMKTRTLTRPMAILLSNGFMHAYFQQHPDENVPAQQVELAEFGSPEIFVPQKIRAKRKLLLLLAAGTLVGLAATIYFW